MRSSLSAAAIAAFACMAAALPQQQTPRVRCGSAPSDSFIEKSAKMAASAGKGLSINPTNQSIEVETYFHVVAGGGAVEDGNVTDAMLRDQLDVLNTSYEPHSISFDLVNISRTVNTNWTYDGAELEMKRSLRRGGYDALNVYFLSDMAGTLGYCYFPDDVEPDTEEFFQDGCNVLAGTVPGGNEEQYNLGGTTVHEVGHWMGLFHTFQGGCEGVGDEVADTPAQLSPTSGCPKKRDSCPGKEGLDPIHNFMDYSTDACYEEFTPGQERRMYNMWNNFRSQSSSTLSN